MSDKNKGYRCKQCGREHDYPAYVFAHWNETLVHTCDCGAKHKVLRGVAKLDLKKSELND